MKKKIRMISKDGTISKFPRYTSSKEEDDEEEEEEEKKEESEKKGSNEASKMGNVNNANANGGNGGNGGMEMVGIMDVLTRHSWLVILETMMGKVQARGREAVIGMSWVYFKALLVEEFCPSNEIKKLKSEFWNHTMVGTNHEGYTDRFHELAKLVPHLVTLESKRIGRILTDEAVCCGTLTRSTEKGKEVKETSKQGGSWKDNKKAKVGKGFVATVPPRNVNVGAYPKDCRAPFKQGAPVSAVRMENNQRVCYEFGSSKHLHNTYPNLNRAPCQAGNRLAWEDNQNTQNNRNQAKGRAFSVNAVDALNDPNVVTGTLSLNDHFATVLFDYGADFSFISTKYAPLLNVKPRIVSHDYVIEVANGKKKEVDRIIRYCKLELGNSLFTIDLIPLGHGSFDVIVGMDWLSKNKDEIVCHEKVVRILLKGGEILHVQGERTLGGIKTLMSTRANEPEMSDIPDVRELIDVFLEDLSGLPPQRQVEFRIDLISGATLVAKSPYRLAPSEMQELSEQLQELQDKGFIRPRSTTYLTSCKEHVISLKIDLRSSYHLLRVNEDDIPKTAFRMRYRHFEFTVMPFGLTNAPAVFTDLMNQVCKPYLDKLVIGFIDDILIYSKTKEDREVYLKLVLELLKKERFKIEAVKNWKAPTTPPEIRSFLRKTRNFVVYGDASNQGLGCVLMQRGKVIAYASRQLKIHEKYYTIHDLQLGAVVFDLKTWRHYLYGTKSVIYTDHKSLQHIFDQKELNMHQRRWIELFSDYECEIRYHPAQSEAFKEENMPAERLHGLDKQMERKEDENLYFMDRIWVLLVGGVRTIIMDEAHNTRYYVHPGVDKMYHDL
nr:hypothetical protein [Tanacetum cinerariifolium]